MRQTAGMVFQNPDNQLVSSIVEDDVAFGPENLGIEHQEIRKRVDQALESVNMGKYKKRRLIYYLADRSRELRLPALWP